MMSGTHSASGILRKLIEQSGQTVKDVALASGVRPSTLYTIIGKGKESDLIDLKTLDALAQYLGYDITVFLGLDNYQPRVQLTADERSLLEGYRLMCRMQPEMAKEVMEMVREPKQPLTGEEKKLLSIFGDMNDQGQLKIIDLCLDMQSGGRYRR